MGETEGIKLPELMVVGLIGMLMLAIAIIVFFVAYQRRLHSQRDEMREMELEYQKGLLNSSIQTQEAERSRIAADLHDSIGSQLSATRLYIKQISPGQESDDIEYLQQESLSLLNETIRNVRDITQNLVPPSLEKFGVIAAVEDLASRMKDLNLLAVEFTCNIQQRFDLEKEIALYRIVQELINNTIKHAGATQAGIIINFEKHLLKMTYHDNGKGFDVQQFDNGAKPKGLGLKNIESRASMLGAALQWKSENRQGVTLTITFPI